jgi:hypothetical protein
MRRVRVLLLCTILHFSFADNVRAQEPLTFFPHHAGDIWEYIDPNMPTFYDQNIIASDSTGSDGCYYLRDSFWGRQRLDTVSLCLYGQKWGGLPYSNLIYMLDAGTGDHWVVQRNEWSTLVAHVVDVYTGLVLGRITTVKQIDFTDSASGLLMDTDYLASGFGLIGQDNDGFPVRRIRGVRLNGITYGTITGSAVGEGRDLPRVVALNQNFPNPFNPSTTISFALPRTENITLKVYDMLGREVATLVDGREDAGEHSVKWNAEGFASGVYFCRMQANGIVLTQKILLVR